MKLFKNINPSFHAITAITAVVVLGACAPEKVGPDLFPASSNFALLQDFESSDDEINFVLPDQSISFSSKFNEKVSWEVEVVGLASGAVKKYKGIGSEFDADEVLFIGKSSGVPFFKTSEYLKATLSILGHDSIYVVDSISTEGSYSYHKKEINGVKHIVVDDFESSSADTYKKVSLAASPDQADSQTKFIATEAMSMQGARSYYMVGKDDNKNSWCGGINNENLIDFYMVSPNELLIDSGIKPEELYFNVYIYGSGKSSTSVQLKVYELDYKVDELGNPISSREDMRNFVYDIANTTVPKIKYDQSSNDGYIYDIEVTWTGWKLISAPYSKFKPANDFLAGGNGDRKKESWRIAGMAVSLLSQPTPGLLTETYMDYLVITQGGKFQQ